MDGLDNPADGPITQCREGGIEPDLVCHLARLDLIEGFVNKVAVSGAFDAQLEDVLHTDIERLPYTCAAARDKEDNDGGVILLHPSKKFLRLVYRPAVNLPNGDLRRQ
jgi:hypothetical protein